MANTLGSDPFGRLASRTKSGVTTTCTVTALDQRMAKGNISTWGLPRFGRASY